MTRCWHDEGIVRHLHLAALAHLTLTRLGPTAVGAPAKQLHTDVLLPKFQTRLATLRHPLPTNRTHLRKNQAIPNSESAYESTCSTAARAVLAGLEKRAEKVERWLGQQTMAQPDKLTMGARTRNSYLIAL